MNSYCWLAVMRFFFHILFRGRVIYWSLLAQLLIIASFLLCGKVAPAAAHRKQIIFLATKIKKFVSQLICFLLCSFAHLISLMMTEWKPLSAIYTNIYSVIIFLFYVRDINASFISQISNNRQFYSQNKMPWHCKIELRILINIATFWGWDLREWREKFLEINFVPGGAFLLNHLIKWYW